jgi:hypothetical protein
LTPEQVEKAGADMLKKMMSAKKFSLLQGLFSLYYVKRKITDGVRLV